MPFACESLGYMNRYDLGLIGPALQYIEDEFSLGSVTKEVVVAATKAGAVPGGKGVFC